MLSSEAMETGKNFVPGESFLCVFWEEFYDEPWSISIHCAFSEDFLLDILYAVL